MVDLRAVNVLVELAIEQGVVRRCNRILMSRYLRMSGNRFHSMCFESIPVFTDHPCQDSTCESCRCIRRGNPFS